MHRSWAVKRRNSGGSRGSKLFGILSQRIPCPCRSPMAPRAQAGLSSGFSVRTGALILMCSPQVPPTQRQLDKYAMLLMTMSDDDESYRFLKIKKSFVWGIKITDSPKSLTSKSASSGSGHSFSVVCWFSLSLLLYIYSNLSVIPSNLMALNSIYMPEPSTCTPLAPIGVPNSRLHSLLPTCHLDVGV